MRQTVDRSDGIKKDLTDHTYYAHSLPGEPPEKWQPLEEHLKNVAEMAKELAEEFGAGKRGVWRVHCMTLISIVKDVQLTQRTETSV
jgi:hypothetical protein